MMQTDSIAEAAGLLTPEPFGLDTLAPDTLSLDTPAVDSLWADSISMPLGSSSLLATADSSLNWFDDSVLYASHWPVTLWGDTLKPFLSLYDQLHDFGVPRSYHLLGDDGVQGLLLGSFLFMLLIYAFSRSYFKTQARRFFIPSNNDSQLNAVKTPKETYVPLLMSLLLCCNNGLLLFAFLDSQYSLSCGMFSPPQVLAVCVLAFVAYNLLRWSMYRFVNWVFFEKSEKKTWNVGFSFLLMLETTLFYPFVLYALNTGMDMWHMAIFVVLAYGILRFLLLCHSFRVFFRKIHGLLHLFAYLCTLEMVSAFCMWKLLVLFDIYLIAK